MDTTQKFQESYKYINFINKQNCFTMLQVLHEEVNKRQSWFFLFSWAKVPSEQMSFHSAMEDVQSFCCPDVNGEPQRVMDLSSLRLRALMTSGQR